MLSREDFYMIKQTLLRQTAAHGFSLVLLARIEYP